MSALAARAFVICTGMSPPTVEREKELYRLVCMSAPAVRAFVICTGMSPYTVERERTLQAGVHVSLRYDSFEPGTNELERMADDARNGVITAPTTRLASAAAPEPFMHPRTLYQSHLSEFSWSRERPCLESLE